MALSEPVNIVWLKRDLRLRDHPPLLAAAQAGQPYIVLYCFEPSQMACPRHSPRHWRFVAESLRDLRQQGLPLTVFWGEVTEALALLAAHFRLGVLFSHQETGHKHSFDRDRAVARWCLAHGVIRREAVQDGVIRGRKHRIGFVEKVDAFLARPQVPMPVDWCGVIDPAATRLPPAVITDAEAGDFTRSRTSAALFPQRAGLYFPDPAADPLMQPGGETVAWRYLRSFTDERADGYSRQIGNPSSGRRSSSRLSTYLAWGCISMRQVYQWTKRIPVSRPVGQELRRFRERLWWRAHYYQKLEAEWQIERSPLNPALAALGRQLVSPAVQPGHPGPSPCTCVPRPDPAHPLATGTAAYERLVKGTTGFPMIDASVRCLEATGWLNFRMRAMLVTFATFVLWLDWRSVATFLSSRFLDYDPGIHYGQLQMQAGLTGYHIPRNYNPWKQGEEKDPQGVFVHRWLPELRKIPAPWCHYPHRMTPLEQQLYGYREADYPSPMVDYAQASRTHMDRYWSVRNSAAAQEALPAIWARHCLPDAMEQYLKGQPATPRREPGK